MKLLLAAALMLLCVAGSTAAQSVAVLVGSIVDQTGAPLPGVRVTIRGVAVRMADTGAAGDFAFPDLPEGDYEISAELSGFERQRRAVRVRAGERVTVSFTLRVALVEETIVTAAKAGERDVQEIPIAISAVSQADLGRLGTQTIEEAPALAPSVTFSQNTGWGQLTIRGIGTNAVFAGSDPSSAIYLDGVYLARPAMAFARFLDLERIEVLRGPQGTLYGRNAVGGAMNLIPRPPTNDFQASAHFTAGNFGELRADARMSGPLKRDRVMGSVAFARGVRDGFVRDLEHPDHPLGGDDGTAARGQLRVVFDRRTNLLLSSDVDHQTGIPLTYNKVLVAKPGYQFDNPPDFHDVRTSLLSWSDTLHYGASARLTMTLTPATTLVSLTAFRALDYEFFADSDSTELDLIRTHQLERQHQLSRGNHDLAPAATTDLGRWRVSLQRIGSPDYLERSAGGTIPAPARPARRRDQPRRVRTGNGWIDVPALGNRWRSLHARGEGHRQCRRALCPRGSESADSRFGLQLFRFHCPQRLDAQDRPRDEAAERCARLRVGDTRVQERRLQPIVNGGGPRLRS